MHLNQITFCAARNFYASRLKCFTQKLGCYPFYFAVSANGKETRKKDPTKSRSSSTKPRKIVESSSMEFEQ